jgi:hypothetical protein
LKGYIRAQVASADVQTQWVFGFTHDGDGPQRYGGFDIGS